LFIENNVWILFLRYDDSQIENRKGNKMSVLCPYCDKEIEEAVCDFWLKNFVNYINNFNCPECGNDVEIDVEIEPTFTPYRKKNK
jgi:peptide subunit release factor 1 (eRF1)